MADELKKLFEEQKGKVSDKWSLYLEEWDRLFAPYQNKPINLLEIGILNGGSLEVWGDYFLKAKNLIGCDINPKCNQLEYSDERIKIIVGDANTDEIEKKISQLASNFDIIIDDGSHKSSDVIKSFAKYFPYLTDGGIYIIEDLHSSYWESYEGSLFNPSSSISFFKRLIDIINYEHWRNSKPRNYLLNKFAEQLNICFDNLDLATIHSIEFINSLCIIKKLPPAKNVLGNRIIVGSEEIITTSWHKNNGTTINDVAVNILNDEKLDIFNLVDTVANSNQLIFVKDQEIIDLHQQIFEKTTLLDRLNQQVFEIKIQTSQLKNKIPQINETIKDYEKDVISLPDSIFENSNILDKANQTLVEINLQIKEINFLLDDTQKQKENLNNIITEQRIVISNFRNSNSWKLTAPLRKLKSVINKIFRKQSLESK